jgi:NTP pyrophosphatase (non-canonical NTP hydrolase)
MRQAISVICAECGEEHSFWSDVDEQRRECPKRVDQIRKIFAGLDVATKRCHAANVSAGWWNDLQTGESLIGKRNKGELLMLIVSEISEAMEGERKGLQDDKLPHRPAAEVELADALIRIFDYAGAHGYDVAGALIEKMEYNARRADHKRENRLLANGKKF